MNQDFLKEQDENSAPIQAYSIGELAVLYGQKPKTINRWILKDQAEIGKRQGRFFNPRQVGVIFKRNGFPPKKD
jgi:hypothetical protein